MSSDAAGSDHEQLIPNGRPHSETITSTITSTLEGEPVTYARRYYICMLSSFVMMMQGIVWNTWAPISKSAEAVYGWDDATISLLSNWGPITFIIGTPFFTYMMEVKGLRVVVLTASFLTTLGAGLRCAPLPNDQVSWFIHAGHICNGFAGPIAMAIPPLLSSVWFPVHQRVTATAFQGIWLVMAMGFGFLFGPLMVPDTAKGIEPDVVALRAAIDHLLYIEFGVVVFFFILVLIYFPAAPPTPPSFSASTQRITFREGVPKLLKNPTAWCIALCYALPQGIWNCWASVLEVILKNRDISQQTAGWVGFWSAVIGCACALAFGKFADTYRGYMKLYLIVFNVGYIAASFFFAIAYMGLYPLNEMLLYATNITMAICTSVTQPLFYELICDLAYPVHEGLTGGFMACLNNCFGLTLLFVLMIPNIGTVWTNWACVGSAALCLPLLLFIPEKFARLEMDSMTVSQSVPKHINA